jgi:glucose/arabinose dehydrogenase
MNKLSSLLPVAAALAALGATPQARADSGLPPITFGSLAIKLDTVATGLSAPDYATFAPGDASRLYVVEQNGLLRVIQNGVLQAAPALNISSLVAPPLNPTNANDERGFLGLAFHPDFNKAGSAGYQTLYTYSSQLIAPGTSPTFAAPNNATQGYKNVVSEWKMGAGGVVDASTRREIVSFGKNANNHNGGTIAFGPDGYLYLGLGDGGNANDVGASHIDPGGNSQNLSTPLGKVLRIDPVNPTLTGSSANAVSSNGQYRIPTSNPYQGAGQVAETFAYGFRNPYRFSFDRANGDLILADVGQNNIEEIDRVVLGGNYGWAVKEGDFLFNRTTGPAGAAGTIGARSPGAPQGLIDPITGTLGTLEYDHTNGISITGGFVYHGSAVAALQGKYVFGDLALRNAPPRVDGRLFYADLVTGEIKEFLLPQFANNKLPDGLTVHGFGEDASGELYAMVTNTAANGTGGIVYRIAAVPEPAQWAMFGLGALGLAGMSGLSHRRRRSTLAAAPATPA